MYSRILPMRRIVALVLILATSLPAWAGLVTRPTKTCGTTTYVAEVAAGCITIKSSEVDADFNAIITGGVNNIETANINAAGLGAAALANNSVTSAKIVDGTIVNADINAAAGIVGTKLAVNATTNQLASVAVTGGLSNGPGAGEFDVAVLPSITTRGGHVILTGIWGAYFSQGTGVVETVDVRVYRDATVICTVRFSQSIVGAGHSITLPTPTCIDVAPAAGAHVYKVTAQVSGDLFNTPAISPGAFFVRELT